MDEARAQEILKDAIEAAGLYHLDALDASARGEGHLNWIAPNSYVILDGEFTAEKLEAIAWWMRNKCIPRR